MDPSSPKDISLTYPDLRTLIVSRDDGLPGTCPCWPANFVKLTGCRLMILQGEGSLIGNSVTEKSLNLDRSGRSPLYVVCEFGFRIVVMLRDAQHIAVGVAKDLARGEPGKAPNWGLSRFNLGASSLRCLDSFR